MKVLALLMAPAGLLLATGCGDRTPVKRSTWATLHADSTRTPQEHMQRFTADLSERPTSLSGGAASPEQLVLQFIRAVQQKDTVALMRTHLSRAEFAYLYYPTHPQAQPPYLLPPDLMWMMLEAQSVKGVSVAASELDRGVAYAVEAVHCGTVSRQGENRVHAGCQGVLREESAQAARRALRLGPMVERKGQVKFVSFGAGG